jgi:hypothetical protein
LTPYHYSNIPAFRVSKEFSDPFLHAMGDLAENVGFSHLEPALGRVFAPVED